MEILSLGGQKGVLSKNPGERKRRFEKGNGVNNFCQNFSTQEEEGDGTGGLERRIGFDRTFLNGAKENEEILVEMLELPGVHQMKQKCTHK